MITVSCEFKCRSLWSIRHEVCGSQHLIPAWHRATCMYCYVKAYGEDVVYVHKLTFWVV